MHAPYGAFFINKEFEFEFVILEKLCRFIKIINVKVAPPGKLTITQLITQTYCNIYTDVYNAFYNYAVR